MPNKIQLKTILLSLLLTTIITIATTSCTPQKETIPTTRIKIENLIVSISESGSIKAKRSVNIKTPSSLRGNSKILKIIPEGTLVKKGDFVLQLDGEELQKKIESIEEELKGFKAEIDKSNANHKFSIKQVNYALENAETNFKLAKMRLKQIEFESQSKQQQEKMSFKIAENNYKEIKEKLELQKVINSTERLRLLSKFRRAEIKLEKSNKSLTQLTLTAPDDGLVVYAKIWKGNRTGKIQIGDTPWRGQALIELPDLSEIEVETTVNEVDISKIKVGMKVNIVLDAFREKIYDGEITTISRLAHRDDENYGLNVFDVVVKVINVDEHLKPGMSAKCELIISNYDSIITIPIETLFSSSSIENDYIENKISNKSSNSLKNYIYLTDKGNNNTNASNNSKINDNNINNGNNNNSSLTSSSFDKVFVKIIDKNEINVGIEILNDVKNNSSIKLNKNNISTYRVSLIDLEEK